jgi:hypothetical protein
MMGSPLTSAAVDLLDATWEVDATMLRLTLHVVDLSKALGPVQQQGGRFSYASYFYLDSQEAPHGLKAVFQMGQWRFGSASADNLGGITGSVDVAASTIELGIPATGVPGLHSGSSLHGFFAGTSDLVSLASPVEANATDGVAASQNATLTFVGLSSKAPPAEAPPHAVPSLAAPWLAVGLLSLAVTGARRRFNQD